MYEYTPDAAGAALPHAPHPVIPPHQRSLWLSPEMRRWLERDELTAAELWPSDAYPFLDDLTFPDTDTEDAAQ
jgi:hypothetical protein